MSLRVKVLAVMALVLATSVGGSFLVLIRYQRAQLLQNTADGAFHLADTIRATLEHAMLAKDPEEIRRIVLAVGKQPDVAGVFVLDEAARVRFASDGRPSGWPLPETPPDILTLRAGSGRWVLHGARGSALLRIASVIPNAPPCRGCHSPARPILGALVVDRSLSHMEEQLRTNLAYMLASAGLAFILLMTTTYGVLRRVVIRPLANLRTAAQAIEAGDYRRKVLLRRADEIGDLARTLDQMRCRVLEHLEEIQRWGEELERRVTERTMKLQASQAAVVERERQIAVLEAVRAATITLSHHINNATAGITGCRTVLLMHVDEQNEQVACALEGIRTSVQKITSVLRALQQVSRIELTPFGGGLVGIEIEDAIRQALATLESDAQQGAPGAMGPGAARA